MSSTTIELSLNDMTVSVQREQIGRDWRVIMSVLGPTSMQCYIMTDEEARAIAAAIIASADDDGNNSGALPLAAGLEFP